MSFAEHPGDYLSSLPAELRAVTAHTIGSRERFAEELELTRERGYSIDNEENVEGVRCIGAPVLDARGYAHAAVVVQVPSVRLPDTRIRELAPRVVEIATEVARVVPSDRTMRPSRGTY